MSIQSEIERISTNISNAYGAVSDMGGTVPEEATSDNLASAINTIEIGAKIDDANVSAEKTYSSQKIEEELTQLNQANTTQDNRIKALEDKEDYTLPTASATVKGGVMVGNGLAIDSNGVLSLALTDGDEVSY